MKEYDIFIDRIEHIRDWLDKGVFWDSIESPEESARLEPLPELTQLEWYELDELYGYLDLLRNDLDDSEPEAGTVAHRVWDLLQEKIKQYIDAIMERLWALEEEEFEEGE